MDKPLVFIMIFLTGMCLVGLATAFIGLAYHHHKRHYELFHPGTAKPIERVHV
jgi:hypothetical protein